MNVPQSALAAMQQTNDFDTEVVRKQNINALDQVYTADAHILPPGANMIQGREGLRSFGSKPSPLSHYKGAKLATVAAGSLGDRVFEIGKPDLSLSSGQTVTVKYVVQWKQEEGRWKWHVDIWNPNE